MNARRKVAISNIAWPAENEDEGLALAARLGYSGVEIAPVKVFGPLSSASPLRLAEFRVRVEDLGLKICALQGILFKVENVHLFASDQARTALSDALIRVADVAVALGASSCVFGAPGLRDPGDRPAAEAFELARRFFAPVAEAYAARGVRLCFEANPASYGCRFATSTDEALRLVDAVALPGLALQFDTGTVFVNDELPEGLGPAIAAAGHAHASEARLAPLGSTGVDHRPIAAALDSARYVGWVSVEMKASPSWREDVVRAYALMTQIYSS